MKNLKDEIEGILADYEIMRTLTLQGIEQTYKGGVVEELVQALTSLIEQEKERAVMGFIDYMYGQNLPLHKAGVVTVRAFAKQYLAERNEQE